MVFHSDIRVLPGTNSDRCVAKRTYKPFRGRQNEQEHGKEFRRTVRGDPIVLELVVVRALVSRDLEVLLAERLLTMLALEWQEVDEKTRWMGTLFTNSE
jgi:hypothetical protein